MPVPLSIATQLSPYRWYEDRFDSEHCMRVAPEIERLISRSYRSIALSEQTKKKILDLGTSSIIYASLHKSHFDYIAICLKFLLDGLPCPRTIAWSNLLTGITGGLIKRFSRIDMMKWGAVPMERTSSISSHLLRICSQIEVLLKSDKSILVFPEMEMISDSGRKRIKTGRAYSGKIRRFAPALFSPAINVSREGKKVYIVPTSVSYDFVAEDGYFPGLARAEKMKQSGSILASFAGKLYYTLLESHFFSRMYSLGKGNIYVDMGQPILVEPGSSKKELAQRAQQEAARCSRITMPALVCFVVKAGARASPDIEDSVRKHVDVLTQKNANFDPGSDLGESVQLAMQGLAERNIISATGGISVKKPEIVNYYANTIVHHFGAGYFAGGQL